MEWWKIYILGSLGIVMTNMILDMKNLIATASIMYGYSMLKEWSQGDLYREPCRWVACLV